MFVRLCTVLEIILLALLTSIYFITLLHHSLSQSYSSSYSHSIPVFLSFHTLIHIISLLHASSHTHTHTYTHTHAHPYTHTHTHTLWLKCGKMEWNGFSCSQPIFCLKFHFSLASASWLSQLMPLEPWEERVQHNNRMGKDRWSHKETKYYDFS